jgi:hypothetical protein
MVTLRLDGASRAEANGGVACGAVGARAGVVWGVIAATGVTGMDGDPRAAVAANPGLSSPGVATVDDVVTPVNRAAAVKMMRTRPGVRQDRSPGRQVAVASGVGGESSMLRRGLPPLVIGAPGGLPACPSGLNALCVRSSILRGRSQKARGDASVRAPRRPSVDRRRIRAGSRRRRSRQKLATSSSTSATSC